MAASVKYPIGQQSYEELRSSGSLYVDKTMFIEKIVTSGTRYYFLARPRRFGKSLLLSTMKCFYEGKRDLFKGLHIDKMEWRWERYPVLYLDLNLQTGNSDNPGSMERIIYSHLENWEREYDVSARDPELSIRFQNIIKAAYRKTGKKIVVLVDEYDKPLLNQLNDKKGFTKARELLMGIYSNFKSSADYLELVFLSGVSRFGKLSVFSGLNNLEDISFDNEFSAICGMTEQEVTDNFHIGITELAEQEELTYKETLIKLKTYYDGYRFSQLRLNIYNPYSLLQVMKKKKFMNYWIESGTPSLLVEQLKRFDVKLEKLIGADCFEEELKGLDLDNPRPLALLYQTGYLTIKDYNREYGYYTLGIPNREVSDGFFTFILPYYANLKDEGSKLNRRR